MSNLKCPFCGQELVRHWGMKEPALYCCDNLKCSRGGVATESSWQELIRTRKALDVAVDALKEQQRWFGVIRVSLISHLNNQYGTLFKSYDADPTVVNVKRANDILNTAIKKIKALEQKD